MQKVLPFDSLNAISEAEAKFLPVLLICWCQKQLHLQGHVGSLSLVISALIHNFMVVLDTAYIAITVSNGPIIT